MATIQDFIDALKKVRTSADNLNKDVDHKDKREETKSDLQELSLSFTDLRKIFSSLTEEDRAALQREAQELLSGQESLAEYTSDVKKILSNVKNRVTDDVAVKSKIEQNIPEEHKEKTSESLLDTFMGYLHQISDSGKGNRKS